MPQRDWARRIQQISGLGALVAVLIVSAACSTTPAPPPLAPPPPSYVVGAPDLLRVNILPEPEIQREVRVRPDGMISIDLIGDVRAAGQRPEQIAQEIQDRIGRFKRDAVVSVDVVDSPSQFVTIYGEVARPGTFALATETRVSEAIGIVGGTRPFASLNNVRVIRTNGRETEVLPVMLDDIAHGDLSTNIIISEGDLIVVPATLLARIGYVMQMIFFPFQPVLGAASQVGSVYQGYQVTQ